MNKKKKKRLIITCIKNCGNTHVYRGVCLNCGSSLIGYYVKIKPKQLRECAKILKQAQKNLNKKTNNLLDWINTKSYEKQ